jgi:predicted lipid carrier protein YhbT
MLTLKARGLMATAEECRIALEKLTGRIADMDAEDRARHLVDRTMSLRVPDLGVLFLTRIGPDGAEPVRQVDPGTSAQVRFTADSDTVVAIAADPGSFMRAWLSGKLKVQGSVFDLLHLRKLM